MTDVTITAEDVIVTVEQPVIPPLAPPVHVGLVEIEQIVQRGSIWLTGSGAPTSSGGQVGDLYLDVTTGDIYRWQNGAWVYQGTFAPTTMTAAEILAELITVDGSGSGLDADLLDGHDSPYFATQTDMTAVQNKNSTQDTAIQQNTNNIATNTTAIATETTNRTNADTTLQNNINLKANIASPVFTGDPQVPLAGVGDNDASIASTAFVTRALAALPPSGIPEAPNDGLTYGRRSLAWATVVGGASPSDTPPPGPLVNGQLWWKSSTGQFFVWYDDGNSQQWVQVFTQPIGPPTNQVILSLFAGGTAGASELLFQHKFTIATTFAAGLTGSQGVAVAAATASTVFSINKNGTQVATATFAAAGTVPTFAAASSMAFAIGDVLAIIAPATPDTTLANISLSILGTR
jgi:hypothetical protein